MGQVISECGSEELKQLAARDKEIEKELEETVDEIYYSRKLLLLGAAECGKSTVLKQMRILHSEGFSKEEFAARAPVIYANTVTAMWALIEAVASLSIRIDPHDAHFESDADLVSTIIKESKQSEKFTPELVKTLKRLWNGDTIQTCYARSNEFQLISSAKYFLDNVERIAEHDYVPTTQDLLFSRTPTAGVVEVDFDMSHENEGFTFRVFDVGGHRSERRKWIHCFDDVHAIIFISAISEFDQKLLEDNETNRLLESLKLFEWICNCAVFPLKTSMILFLNKIDLFAQKLGSASIRVLFPDYEGK